MQDQQNKFMDTDTLVKCGTHLLEQIAQKHHEINRMQHPVHAQVQPGFLRQILDHKPPVEGESMQQILEDTEMKIFPGLTLWTHPNFFGYYGSNICHPAILAELYSSAFGTPGFNWLCSPVQTELENVVSDWIVSALQLPEKFLMCNSGGGTIADTVSDAIFITIHTAKQRKMKELRIDCSNPQILKFVGYYSENAHNSAFKGLLIKDIPYKRAIPTYFDEMDQNFQIDLVQFEKLINNDIQNGLIPFWCQVTWGTTSTCACEDVQSIAQICNDHKIWVNLDAAYAGSFWVIKEHREKVKGIELVDSVQVNFAKMMMCGNYGSLFFIGDKNELAEAMGGKGNFEIYKNKHSNENTVIDYKDWEIGLGKRFNALKLWWMMRGFGLEGMKEQLQHKIDVAKYLEGLIKKSKYLNLFTKREYSLITFVVYDQNREKQNIKTRILFEKANSDTVNLFVTASEVHQDFLIRVVIINHSTNNANMDQLFQIFESLAGDINLE